MLSMRFSKARLLNSCFANGAASVFYQNIASFNATVYTGRWGTVRNATHQLVDPHIMGALRTGWDRARYVAGQGVARDDENVPDEKKAREREHTRRHGASIGPV
eukprot:7254818-Pyramimonas_sp.AAC.2